MCNGKKRHLNPPDSQFCGQCGTADLTDAASFVPLGSSIRLLVWGIVLGLLWWGGGRLVSWGSQGFEGLTGYKSLAIWLIEKSVNVLYILFVFYFLAAFIPGEAGRQFRGLLSHLCLKFLHLGFHIVHGALRFLSRLLALFS